MKLESAKCPNCGASLKISRETEKIECEYCHEVIFVDDAIACYKLKVSGNVSVEGVTTNAELIDAANELLDMGEYLKAKRKFLEFSEKCPDNYQGWLGLLICRTRNFKIKDNNIMFENDVKNYYNHFKNTASEEVFNQYFETIDRYFDPEKYKRLEQLEREKQWRESLEESARKKEEEKIKRLEENKKVYAETIRRTEELKRERDLKKANMTTKDKFAKYGNIALYVLGCGFIIAGLGTSEYPVGEKILMVLFGLSLFKFFYDVLCRIIKIRESKIKIIRIVLPIAILVVNAILFPTSNNNQKRYDEIKADVNKELERYVYVVQPKCQKGSSRHITHKELVENAGFDKEKLLDVDKKSYCMIYAPVKCIENGKLEWKVYISCNDYADKEFVKWDEPFESK